MPLEGLSHGGRLQFETTSRAYDPVHDRVISAGRRNWPPSEDDFAGSRRQIRERNERLQLENEFEDGFETYPRLTRSIDDARGRTREAHQRTYQRDNSQVAGIASRREARVGDISAPSIRYERATSAEGGIRFDRRPGNLNATSGRHFVGDETGTNVRWRAADARGFDPRFYSGSRVDEETGSVAASTASSEDYWVPETFPTSRQRSITDPYAGRRAAGGTLWERDPAAIARQNNANRQFGRSFPEPLMSGGLHQYDWRQAVEDARRRPNLGRSSTARVQAGERVHVPRVSTTLEINIGGRRGGGKASAMRSRGASRPGGDHHTIHTLFNALELTRSVGPPPRRTGRFL
jgi:hypothetical protein